ncbi:MAG: lysophospholipid acyltransferase family protein [Myxococcota bacterium]
MRDALVRVLERLPLWIADAMAWAIAWTWWWIVPVRRGEAVANLQAALPEAPARATLVRMMHDLVLGYVEILQFGRLAVTVEGAEAIPPGSILLAGHGGSWDVALLAWADAVPLGIFLKTPSDPWVRDLLARLRREHDVLALETGARMKDAYAALAAGRSIMFIQDQRFGKGVPSPFFGRPALTSAGLAAAVLKTGRPVFGCWQWREGVGRHRLRVEPLALPPLTGDREVDARAITDATNRWYEAQIRARPHGWLWLHRRWKGA